MDDDVERSRHFDELSTIEENALYTGQAHHELASAKSKQVKLLLVVCSALAGLSGLVVALGAPPVIGVVAVIANTVTGVAAAFGIQDSAGKYEAAARQWTRLRHDARTLRDVEAIGMSTSELQVRVVAVATRYNDLVAALPSTSNEAFENARSRIQAGRFEPDFKEKRLPRPDEKKET